MAILYFLLVSYIFLSISLFLVFPKLNEKAWKGLVPGLNFMIWSKKVGRPAWWAALLLIPIVNFFIFAGLSVALVRSFKKYRLRDSALAVAYPPLAILILALSNVKYDGPSILKERAYTAELEEAKKKGLTKKWRKLQTQNPYYKSWAREWVEAAVFAVFAAAFIRMFTIEAFAIPTSSMEGTLLVGDHLFVSKLHYGLRTPETVAMVPLLHNRIPIVDTESYFEHPRLPYWRFPAFETIDRNDLVVFNYPEGDSVYLTPDRNYSIYDLRRGTIPDNIVRKIQNGKIPLVTRPVDKMDFYVKRCIAEPGDTLEIRDRVVYINGKPTDFPENVQFRYLVKHKNPLNLKRFEDWGITEEDQQYFNPSGPNHKMLVLNEEQLGKVRLMEKDMHIIPNDMYWVVVPEGFDRTQFDALEIDQAHVRAAKGANQILLTLSKEQLSGLRNLDAPLNIQAYNETEFLFPSDPVHFPLQNVDNFGPIWIPKKGATITLTSENIALFKRTISIYEKHDFQEKDGQYYIDGKLRNEYTFEMDYYWMMGDNRHNSEDSRVWGWVPETHIVGKPLFIFFSTKENSLAKGIHWDRVLKVTPF